MTRLLLNFAALALGAALAACGGGDDDTPTSTDTWAANCTGSPTATTDTAYLGVTPDGGFGTWHIDTTALTVDYDVNGEQGHASLDADAATCSYQSTDTGALRTALHDSGMAVGAAKLASGPTPAMLVAHPERSLAAIAGHYNVLRKMSVTPEASATAQFAGYGAFSIDTEGNWSFCPDSAFGPACTPLTGFLVAERDGSFSLVMVGQVHGRLIAKTEGGSRLMLLAINNPFDPSLKITGMWVGSSDDALGTAGADGRYLVNDSASGSAEVTLSAGSRDDGSHHDTLLPAMPQTGFFSVANAAPAEFGLVSSLGVIASAQPAADGSATMHFGVKGHRQPAP